MAGKTSLRYKDPDKITNASDKAIRDNLGRVNWAKLHEVFIPYESLTEKQKEALKADSANDRYWAMISRHRKEKAEKEKERKNIRIFAW